MLQALYFCKPFRDQIIQYKLEYNHRTLNLSNKDLSALNNNANSDSNDTSNFSSNTLSNTNSNNLTNTLNSSNNSSLNNGEIKNVNGANNSILKQEHLLNCLAELFHQIVTMKKKKGIMQPKKFIARLRKDNGKETTNL